MPATTQHSMDDSRAPVLGGRKDRLPLSSPDRHAALLFTQVAAAHPEKLALIHRASAGSDVRETLTYGELDDRSSRLAALLRQHGVEPGDRVALFFEPSLEMLVSILGVLKAGCAYVPLDPTHPDDRLRYCLSHSAACVLLTHHELLSPARQFAAAELPMISIDDGVLCRQPSAEESRPCMKEQRARLTTDDPIYVMYTSGTTGRPKGVVCAHRNIIRVACSSALDVHAGDVLINTSTYAFDGSVLSIFGGLLNGATLVIVPAKLTLDFEALGRVIEEEGVTWLFLTTALLTALTTTSPKPLARLRRILFGGEAASPSMCAALFDRVGPGKLVNLYGPTETGVIASWFRIDSLADIQPEVPIGYPVFGSDHYVLDEELRPVGKDGIGELCVGGPAVGVGYLNDEEQTRRAFPTLELDGASRRIYRTGDVVQRRADGCLYFRGRRDDQVKINGFRIEPGEVQAKIESSPGVHGAYVCVSAVGASKTIDAFVTPDTLDVGTLRASLRQSLPGYLLPQRITPVATLPLTPNGKVDRRALMELRAAADALEENGAAEPNDGGNAVSPAHHPSGPRACGGMALDVDLPWQLASLVRSMTQDADARVTPTTRFDALGLDSLQRAMLLSRIRTDLSMSASVVDMFAARDCQELADCLRTSSSEDVLGGGTAAELHNSTTARWRHLPVRAAGLLIRALIPAVLIGFLVAAQRSFAIGEAGVAKWMLGVSLSVVTGTLAVALLAVAGKWLFVGRYREGRFSRSTSMFWRHLVVEGLLDQSERILVPLFGGTALLNFWGRLLGARIGPGAILESAHLSGADLVHIGAGAVLERDAAVRAADLRDGCVVSRSIHVGAKAVLRRKAVLVPGSKLDEAVTRAPLQSSDRGNEPGAASSDLASDDASAWSARPLLFLLAQLGAVLALLCYWQLPFLLLLDVATWIFSRFGLVGLAACSPLLVVASLLVTVTALAVPYRLVTTRLREGRHALFGLSHLCWWMGERVWALASWQATFLQGTLLLPPLLRLYGARIGPACEIGSAEGVMPSLLAIDRDCFIGSESSLGGGRLSADGLELRRTTLGRNAFLGNEAFVAGGARIGPDVLVGSLASVEAALDTGEGKVWVGAPAQIVSSRPERSQLDEELFRPRPTKYLQRVVLEALGLVVTPFPLLAAAAVFLSLAYRAGSLWGSWSVALWPLVYLLAAAAAGLVAVIVKWVVVGRYRSDQVYHLWNDAFIRRRNAVEQVLALASALLLPLRGTWLWSCWWRLLGARIGEGALLFTAKILEPDLVTVGARSLVARETRVQGHTFEERRLRQHPISIGDDVTLGYRSLVLPGSHIENGATLLPLTLSMKGETLTRDFWVGSPARPAGETEGLDRSAGSSTIDDASAMPGRELFRQQLAAALEQRASRPCTVALLEVAYSRSLSVRREGINDELLARLSRVLATSLRDQDLYARYGERQLVVMLPNVDADTAARITSRLRARFASATHDLDSDVSLSAGVATHEELAESADEVLCAAEAALLLARGAGEEPTSGGEEVQRALRADEGTQKEDSAAPLSNA